MQSGCAARIQQTRRGWNDASGGKETSCGGISPRRKLRGARLIHHLINWRLFWVESLNGLTLAALYFTVASGFTLIFGLMRVVNMAHGSLYLLGAYVGYEAQLATGSWVAGLAAGALTAAALGAVLQQTFFSWMQGQDLRQALVSIGISIVLADLMLWQWGGTTYQLTLPNIL